LLILCLAVFVMPHWTVTVLHDLHW
jgi:hypothetical protein